MIELPVLKRGLEILQRATRNRKEELQTRIQQKKPITEEEEIWLDGKGNNVDGEALIGLLESARDYEQVVPKPSRKDALMAASVLRGYIIDLDSPLFRRLEDSLASFGIQTRYEVSRTMKATKISDHFASI
ncbi:Pyruvate decarboxylase 2 [Pleurotus ostreatus]|nr:Pyruvate decarboxylase 2 [Pleurotus ostreatus]